MGRKGDRDQKRMVSVYLPDIYSHVERIEFEDMVLMNRGYRRNQSGRLSSNLRNF